MLEESTRGLLHFLPGELPGDRETVENAVDRGRDTGFGGREDAEDDAEDDDERHDEGTGGIEGREDHFLDRALAAHEVVPAQPEENGVVDHEAEADHDAGQEAAQEELADREFRVVGVEDHGDARRDEGADGGGRGDQGHRVILSVALPDHGRNHDRTHGRGVGDAGTGDAGEDHLGNHGDVAEAALEASHQGVGEIYDLVGYLRLHHDVAGQDEEGDGHEAEGVDASEGFHRDHGEGNVEGDGRGQGGDDEGHEDGKAEENQGHEKQEYPDYVDHRASSFRAAKGFAP